MSVSNIYCGEMTILVLPAFALPCCRVAGRQTHCICEIYITHWAKSKGVSAYGTNILSFCSFSEVSS